MHPKFPDAPSSPFFKPVEETPTFLGLNVDQYAEIVGVGAVAIVGAHLARRALTKEKDDGGDKKTVETQVKPSEVVAQ
jgi:Ni,Fe-hydrogenase I small subunit